VSSSAPRSNRIVRTAPHPARRPALAALALAVWAAAMLTLIGWGLPGRERDELLFDDQPPWEAQRYSAARAAHQRRERAAGADTDLDPIAAHRRIVDVTTDAFRLEVLRMRYAALAALHVAGWWIAPAAPVSRPALLGACYHLEHSAIEDSARGAILLRYRLYSRQPDEMITFMALQRMRPRRLDFDPRLYQYGGAYVYLVGAASALSAALGFTKLTGDVGFYLTRPELFAHFYLVARLITLVFAGLLLVSVVRLARRAAGRTAGWIAALLLAACPVFISGALEAKPHVPSACMLIWATLSALDYHARGRWRDARRLGWQAGLASGFVLTGLASLLILPMLYWTSRRRHAAAGRHVLACAGLAIAIYVATNPYPILHAVLDRASLASNIANSTAMYRIERLPAGALRVGALLIEGVGAGVGIAGLLALPALIARHRSALGVAAVAGAALLVLFAAIGAGKPAEFARFLVLPAALFCVAGAAALSTLWLRHKLIGAAGVMLVLLLMPTYAYVRSFALDAWSREESRRAAGRYLRDQVPLHEPLGVVQEPAPYAVPPLDFTRRTVRLLPRSSPPRNEYRKLPAWLVLTADDESSHAGAWWRPHYQLVARFPGEGQRLSPITWANKPVFVYRRPQETGGTPVPP
jgi:hypothetical protein